MMLKPQQTFNPIKKFAIIKKDLLYEGKSWFAPNTKNKLNRRIMRTYNIFSIACILYIPVVSSDLTIYLHMKTEDSIAPP